MSDGFIDVADDHAAADQLWVPVGTHREDVPRNDGVGSAETAIQGDAVEIINRCPKVILEVLDADDRDGMTFALLRVVDAVSEGGEVAKAFEGSCVVRCGEH